MYLIELENGVWVADWAGDPGRTLKIENATTFLNKKTAEKRLRLIKKTYTNRKFDNAKIIDISF